MKYKNIFWGIVLIGLGVLFILKNLNVIQFNWVYLLELWPLLLVFWGISLLPVKEIIKFVLYVVALIIGIYLINTSKFDSVWYWKFKKMSEYSYREQLIEEDYKSEYKYAHLKLSAVSGVFNVKGNTDKLISFSNKSNIGNYKIDEKINDSTIIVKLGLENSIVNIDKSGDNNSLLLLNNNPIWNLYFEAGASDINLDVRDFKVEKVKFDGGATNLNITLGNKYPNTNINVEAGASSIKISIPRTSGCELVMDNVLSSKKIDGFNNINDNVFRTENYDTATAKIKIYLEAAVSKLEIIRY